MRDKHSVACVAYFDGDLSGAGALRGPHPEASDHEREPLCWPPVEHHEAATRPALDPPANVTASPDDQVLLTHPRILHRGEKALIHRSIVGELTRVSAESAP